MKKHIDGLCYRDLACLLPGMFASVANALHAAIKHSNVVGVEGDYNLERLLLTLSSLIDSPRIPRCSSLLILASRVDRFDLYFVEQASVQSIAHSLLRLADLGRIGSHQNCPARLVARSLLSFVKLYDIEHARVEPRASQFSDGTITQLEDFSRRFPTPRPTSRRQTT